MIGKIFLMVDVPFSERDHKRFGIDIFLKNEFEIIVWDIGKITNYNSYSLYSSKYKFTYENLVVFDDKFDLKKKIKSVTKSDVVIIHFNISLKNRFLYEYFNKNKIYYGSPPKGIVPEINTNNLSYYYRTFSLLRRLFNSPLVFIQSIIEKYFGTKLYKNLDYKFFIVTGSKSIDLNKHHKCDLIYSHQLDYDILLNRKIKQINFNSKFAVFLDEYVPFHPDNNNRPKDCKEDDYYNDLNNFFNKIEKKLNLKVIISAHPRSNYNNEFNPFQGRKIIFGESINLVKKSYLVLTHASTANNFTVAYKKPVFFINSKKYSEYFSLTIETFSSEFDKRPIDISSDYDIDFNDALIDENIYQNYMEKYIKSSGSSEINSWLIFINHLNLKFQ